MHLLRVGPVRTQRLVLAAISPFLALGATGASLRPVAILSVILVSALALVRTFRTGVSSEGDHLIVRNLIRTRTIAKEQIDSASFAGRLPGWAMRLQLCLKDGSHVKASGVSVRSKSFEVDVSPATREREMVEVVRGTMERYGVRFE